MACVAGGWTPGGPGGRDHPLAGVLPDGTLLEQFVTVAAVPAGPNSLQVHFSDLGFYGWKPGASAWTPLTPGFHGPLGSAGTVWLDRPTSAHQTGLWTLVDEGGDVTLEYCRLAA